MPVAASRARRRQICRSWCQQSVIRAQTARTLGLTVPPTLLARGRRGDRVSASALGPDHAQRVPLMGLALLIVAALVAAIPALAHSWYPLACCGNIASRSPAISWWRRARAGSTSQPATCSGVSKCSRVRTTIAMYASGAAVITARSARSSCRTRSGAAACERGQNQDRLKTFHCPLTDPCQFDIVPCASGS